MQVEVILPNLRSERVSLSAWYADPGELVYEGDRLVEVLIQGATFDVPSPATGRLAEKRVYINDRLHAGQVLGLVEIESDNGM